jgi:hypothetical protein
MVPSLPDGRYPFIDEWLPLSDMTMVEAPPRLEALFKSQAAKNGVDIIRDDRWSFVVSQKNTPTRRS